jgi:hypothetical protein
MKYYSSLSKYRRKDQKVVLQESSSLDLAILARAGTTGADFYEIWNACRPYKNRNGVKLFASSARVREEIKKLKEKDLLEIG